MYNTYNPQQQRARAARGMAMGMGAPPAARGSIYGAPGAAVAPDPPAAPAVNPYDYTGQLPGLGGGGFGGAKRVQKGMRNMFFGNARAMNPALMQSIQDLMFKAGPGAGFDPERRAAFLAPHMEAANDFETQALGQAARGMAQRGLGDSSYGAAVEAGIRSNAAGQRAGAVSGLIDAERGEQRADQAALRAALFQLVTGQGGGAADIAGRMRDQNLQQQQFAQDQGFGIGDIFSGLGGLAGMWLGRPRMPR